MFWPKKDARNAVSDNVIFVWDAAKINGAAALANIANLIQRWRPKRATPYGAKKAPRNTPIPATLNAIPKPCKPSSGRDGSLNEFRSSNNAVSVNAVKPPRWTAVATIPLPASTWRRKKARPSRISVNPWAKDAAAFSCFWGPISYLRNRLVKSAAAKYPAAASNISSASAWSARAAPSTKARTPTPIPPPKTTSTDPPVTAIAFAVIKDLASINKGRPADSAARIKRLIPNAISTTIVNSTPVVPLKTRSATKNKLILRARFA